MTEPNLEHMLACVERGRLLAPLMELAMEKLRQPTCSLEEFKRFSDLHKMVAGELPMPETLA